MKNTTPTPTPTVTINGIEVPAYMGNTQRVFFAHYYRKFLNDGVGEKFARTLAEFESLGKIQSIEKTRKQVHKSEYGH